MKSSDIIATGLMTFALFLGAGNIIFPPFLGHMAGSELISAIAGFLLTGVGLPLLGVIACARVGGGLDKLTEIFPTGLGNIFAIILFLALGPLFAAPRAAVVAYELGLTPFTGSSPLTLAVFSAVFFAITLYFALFPGRLVDMIGKMMTPLLVVVLLVIAIGVVFFFDGTIGQPTQSMIDQSFFNGFREGYNTMDTLGALVFGVIIINAIQSRGVTNPATIARYAFIAGLIAAIGLSLVYVLLGYVGATSQSLITNPANGTDIIELFVEAVFSDWGKMVLALTVILACLTTAVGLMSACGEYFAKTFPVMGYHSWVVLCTVASALIANVGLTVLLNVTIPALLIIYPISIALIIVTLLRSMLAQPKVVMGFILIPVSIISLIEGLHYAGIEVVAPAYNMLGTLPLFEEGLVWLVPGVCAGLIGYLVSLKQLPKAQGDIEAA